MVYNLRCGLFSVSTAIELFDSDYEIPIANALKTGIFFGATGFEPATT